MFLFRILNLKIRYICHQKGHLRFSKILINQKFVKLILITFLFTFPVSSLKINCCPMNQVEKQKKFKYFFTVSFKMFIVSFFPIRLNGLFVNLCLKLLPKSD